MHNKWSQSPIHHSPINLFFVFFDLLLLQTLNPSVSRHEVGKSLIWKALNTISQIKWVCDAIAVQAREEHFKIRNKLQTIENNIPVGNDGWKKNLTEEHRKKQP